MTWQMLRDLVLYTVFMFVVLAIISGHLEVHAQYLQRVNVEVEMLGLSTHEAGVSSGLKSKGDRVRTASFI